MFVAMGLSAIFPVFHGLNLYGIGAMNEMIGLSWLVLQGVLYILGAGLYAVRRLAMVGWKIVDEMLIRYLRLAFLNVYILESTICGAAHISCSIS